MVERTQAVDQVPTPDEPCPFCLQRRALSGRWPHEPFHRVCASCAAWADLEVATARMPADMRRAVVEVCEWAIATTEPADFNRLLAVVAKVVTVEH